MNICDFIVCYIVKGNAIIITLHVNVKAKGHEWDTILVDELRDNIELSTSLFN
jgi:hypothetical protein